MSSATVEHSCQVDAPRQIAWDFWSDSSNWALDPGVEAVELDGPFVTGTRGVTKTADQRTLWRIANVETGKSAVLTMRVGRTDVEIEWAFSEVTADSTLMTQKMTFRGPQAEEAAEIFKSTMPEGMAKLAKAIEDSAG